MSPVTSGPPLDGSLDGTCTGHGESELERGRGVVRSVGPESVVTGSDTESSDVVVDDTDSQPCLTLHSRLLTSRSRCFGCMGW